MFPPNPLEFWEMFLLHEFCEKSNFDMLGRFGPSSQTTRSVVLMTFLGWENLVPTYSPRMNIFRGTDMDMRPRPLQLIALHWTKYFCKGYGFGSATPPPPLFTLSRQNYFCTDLGLRLLTPVVALARMEIRTPTPI